MMMLVIKSSFSLFYFHNSSVLVADATAGSWLKPGVASCHEPLTHGVTYMSSDALRPR